MILVDTSVLVAFLDKNHDHHRRCARAIVLWAGKDQLAVSSVTFAELAAGGRSYEALNEDLDGLVRIELDFDSAWRAGQSFRTYRRSKIDSPVLPDFLIRAQAAVLNLRHLTNDRRRTAPWPDVDFIFPEE